MSREGGNLVERERGVTLLREVGNLFKRGGDLVERERDKLC